MLVAARGRLIQDLPEGAMLSVLMPAEEMEKRLSSELCIAAVNAPGLCVVSGPKEYISELQCEFEKENIGGRPLHTSHAFHSQMVDAAVDPFTECVGKVRLSPPAIPFVTNVTGDWIKVEEATDPEHWGRHIRATVRFADGIKRLWEDQTLILLEVGPRTTSTTLARQQAKNIEKQIAISSLGDTADNHGEWSAMLNAVGQLWSSGVAMDWAAFYEEEKRHRVPLPTYPFERKRFWVEPAKVHTLAGDHQVMASEEATDNTARQFQPAAIPKSSEEGAILKLEKNLEEASGRDLSGVRNSMTFLETREIETALAEHKAVKQAAVIVKELRPGDARLTGYIVTEPDEDVTATELRKYLRTKLSEYMIPNHIFELEALFLTPAGKIDRKALAAQFDISAGTEKQYVTPQTEFEKIIASAWQEVLGIDRISVRDNFFDIGGNSLLCIQAISRIRKVTGIGLNPRSILLNTLSQIAHELESFLPQSKLSKEGEIQRSGNSTLGIFRKVKRKLGWAIK
jgi:acyl transferase domain-containing protein